ncbi:SAP domain-containing protein [Kribbella sp. NPDC051770]|uniref:SAP domain-containing protein n=1 Tax=Kribbella sp. NPDC051770 TaxID=3155413 RepID=UPI00341F5C22
MSEQVKVGDTVDLGKNGYVRLPDGCVVTSGRTYVVRHEGTHALVVDGNEREIVAVDPNKPSDNGDDESDDYNDWKVETLRQELRERELPTSGTKPELVARLEADDDSDD